MDPGFQLTFESGWCSPGEEKKLAFGTRMMY